MTLHIATCKIEPRVSPMVRNVAECYTVPVKVDSWEGDSREVLTAEIEQKLRQFGGIAKVSTAEDLAKDDLPLPMEHLAGKTVLVLDGEQTHWLCWLT